MRSRLVLACEGDSSNTQIAAALSVTRGMVTKWRNRFAVDRLDGRVDEPRPGRTRTVDDAQIEELITATLETAPRDATHWSTRSMATQLGLLQSPVSGMALTPRYDNPRPSVWTKTADQIIESVTNYYNELTAQHSRSDLHLPSRGGRLG
ncbi:MAG: hypothetical protein QOI25_415 [Mycobacterium sp.]|jgi:hypothetical protein|nr:hypothetical protein [Mycobacterium sp.]